MYTKKLLVAAFAVIAIAIALGLTSKPAAHAAIPPRSPVANPTPSHQATATPDAPKVDNQGYDLKMELVIDGKKIASPQVSVKRGETATVTQDTAEGKTVLEVTANEGQVDNHKGILMKFSISSMSADGTRTVIATPQVLTAVENEKAEINVGSPEEKGRVSLTVSAKRKTF